jgi:hypothetical protein
MISTGSDAVTPAHRRYLAVETLISVVINSAISFAFAWLMFHTSSAISARALIVDSIPQSFMIALMSVVVPGFLTSRRLAAGQIAPLPGKAVRYPLAARAIAAALAAALCGLLLHLAVLAMVAPNAIGFTTLLALKVVYGAGLAAIVTPLMLRYALKAR